MKELEIGSELKFISASFIIQFFDIYGDVSIDKESLSLVFSYKDLKIDEKIFTSHKDKKIIYRGQSKRYNDCACIDVSIGKDFNASIEVPKRILSGCAIVV